MSNCWRLIILGCVFVAASAALGSDDQRQELNRRLAELRDADPDLRAKAARVLGYTFPTTKDPVPALCAALTDPVATVRYQAAIALVRLDPDHRKDAEPHVRAAMKDGDASVRRDAVEALGLLGASAVAPLRAALRDPDSDVRRQALLALVEADPAQAADLVPKLIDALATLPPSMVGFNDAGAALQRIAMQSKETIPDLIQALSNPIVRNAVIQLLMDLGPAAKDAIPKLQELRRGPDAWASIYAAWALLHIDPAEARDAVPVFVAALTHPDEPVRYWAIRWLGEIGPQARSATPSLLATLRQAKDGHQSRIGEALGRIGPSAKELMPALLRMLFSEDWLLAADILHAIGPPAKVAAPALRLMVFLSTDPFAALSLALARVAPEQAGRLEVANIIAEAKVDHRNDLLPDLAAIGPAAKDAVPALLEFLKDWQPYFRVQALQALVRIDAATAQAQLPGLLERLNGKDREEAEYAATAIGILGPAAEATIPQLVAHLSDKNLQVLAVESLGRIGPAANGAILDMLKSAGKVTSSLQGPSLIESLADPETLMANQMVRMVESSCPPTMAAFVAKQAEKQGTSQLLLQRAVAEALGRIGANEPKAVEFLQCARKADDARLRIKAGCALARIDLSLAPDVVPTLQTALANPHWGIRTTAVHSLGAIGPAAKATAPRLVRLLDDPIRCVREAAGGALKEVDAVATKEAGVR